MALAATVVMAGLTARIAHAHPADMYFQSLALHLAPDGVRVAWTISPGPLLASAVWSKADRDQDHVIGEEEARAWVEGRVPDLSATLDGAAGLAWRLVSVEWPTSFDTFIVGDESIRLHLVGDWPPGLSDGASVHHLDLHNQYQEPFSTNWFALHGVEGVRFETPTQQNGQLAFDFAISGDGGETFKAAWDSGTPSLAVAGDSPAESASQPLPDRRTSEILTRLIRAPEPSPLFYLTATVTAILLGALHALTPGHGKAIVAAYLVGSRGTLAQAVGLGSIVTLTHTGSVLALGLIALTASQYVLPTTLFPVLEMASGLLIVGLGGGLLYRRWRYWRAYRRLLSEAAARQPVYERDEATGRTRIVINQPIIEPGPPHEHKFLPRPGDRVTWRSLLAMGVSGGLVPCPDAIAILLIAVTINRVLLGLSLIVAFSVGLAVVLIAIGIMMVQGRRLLVRRRALRRLEPAMPFISAVLVLGLGLGLTFGAARRIGLLAFEASPAPGARFRLDEARILYLDADEMGHSQLSIVPIAGGEPLTLTQEPLGVMGYSLSPDGSTVAYTAAQEERGTEIALIGADGSDRRQALSCPGLICDRAAWSPDGQRLVYERLYFAGKSGFAAPSLWWLALESGETGPLFQDERLPGSDLRWSADGRWISYVSLGSAGAALQIYDSESGHSQAVPARVSQPAIWSPTSSVALMIGDRLWEEGYRSYLLRFDPQSGELTDLSEPASVEDLAAAWSPDGAWIAIVRRELPGAGLGAQIWVMRPDGSEARPLTDTADLAPGTPVWSPDGNTLLFERYSLEARGIWVMDVETGEMWRIVGSGHRPVWLP
jgi:ABC-type nickel/cobalt efflux system permease component RcnA/Tol biopolymer transport system component